MRKAETIVAQASFDQAPARITTLLHRLMREETGTDPYKTVKDEYNRIALGHLPAVRKRVFAASGANERLAAGVRAAIAGNVIDFGIYDSVDLDRALSESLDLPLDASAYQDFFRAVQDARRILFLCDNAGEIALDRVLIDVLREAGKEVVAVVKGVPVINDATLDDAAAVRLSDSATQVIDNGNDGIGTLLELCSEAFRDVYHSADIVISKGQANYETLVTTGDDRIFFLFKVKCPVVAQHMGRENGDIVLMRNQAAAVPAGW